MARGLPSLRGGYGDPRVYLHQWASPTGIHHLPALSVWGTQLQCLEEGNGREDDSVTTLPSSNMGLKTASPTPFVILFPHLLPRLLGTRPCWSAQALREPSHDSGMGVCATGAGEFSHRLGGSECSPAATLNDWKGVDADVLAHLNLCI